MSADSDQPYPSDGVSKVMIAADPRTPIVGTWVDSTSYAGAVDQVLHWVAAGESRSVCVATTHSLMEAHDSARFRRLMNEADLVTPDGMPLVWMLRLKGRRGQQRVYGPTLMLHVLEAAERECIPIGLYGSSPQVMERLLAHMAEGFPKLKISYIFSPPFRELSAEEDEEVIRQVAESGSRILFVGLGCPKQERWMAAHRGRIPAVMIGVGAAFDFHAGLKKQAPPWLQNLGLEWLFRLLHEPRRLWRRYLYHNPRFIVLAVGDLLHFQR